MITKQNHLGIVVEKIHEDSVNGLYLDPMYDPTEHARTYGKVKYLPHGFSHGWNTENDFFQVGDTVHFHYDAIDDKSTVSYEDEDGDRVYIVDIFKIYVRERDGELTPRSGKCLCEPYYEADEGYEVREIDLEGKPVRAVFPVGSELAISFDVKPHDRIAKIRSVGKPLSHEADPEFGVGDTVFREPYTNLAYEMGGETLYVIDQELIMGVYDG